MIEHLSSLPLSLKYAVGPVFHLSQYNTGEEGQQVVRLSAPILTSSGITFTGSIEVDIAAENISAELGKCMIIHLHFASSHFFISIMFSDCLSQALSCSRKCHVTLFSQGLITLSTFRTLCQGYSLLLFSPGKLIQRKIQSVFLTMPFLKDVKHFASELLRLGFWDKQQLFSGLRIA